MLHTQFSLFSAACYNGNEMSITDFIKRENGSFLWTDYYNSPWNSVCGRFDYPEIFIIPTILQLIKLISAILAYSALLETTHGMLCNFTCIFPHTKKMSLEYHQCCKQVLLPLVVVREQATLTPSEYWLIPGSGSSVPT